MSADRFFEDNQVEDLISEEIENIWSEVSKGITDRWLSELDIPLSAEIAILKIRKVVSLAVFQHDGVLDSLNLERSEPEAEPIANVIDPWARGTCPE